MSANRTTDVELWQMKYFLSQHVLDPIFCSLAAFWYPEVIIQAKNVWSQLPSFRLDEYLKKHSQRKQEGTTTASVIGVP